MIIDLQQHSPASSYFQMIQTVVPRPVAWVLSRDEGERLNLAPFSYFNAVCSNPPLIMLSIGKKPDGSEKDTRRNIIERTDFTVHIADSSQLDALNESSATLPAGDSEVEKLGLRVTEFEGHPCPRLEGCRIAFACSLYELHELGALPQTVIYGEVSHIYIDDDVVTVSEEGRVKVHVDKLDPIARLGANEYMQFGEIVEKRRPK